MTTNTLAEFFWLIFDPGKTLTHLPYALLILSMLMRDMGWLRAIAIASGLVRIVNRSVIDPDYAIVFWEVIFVAVNVFQLLLLWWYARHARFSEDERWFLASLPSDVDKRSVRRLLRQGRWVDVPEGTELTTEGEPVNELIFIAEGGARVEQRGRLVTICGRGDFLGEMSFVTGAPATATVVTAKPTRYLRFEQAALRRALSKDSSIERALHWALSRDLSGKLRRVNTGLESATR